MPQPLTSIANQVRQNVIQMMFEAQESHLGSCLSCVEILVALYFKTLQISPSQSLDPNRDRFILSKGHAAASLYATLSAAGFFLKEKLQQYCQNGSVLAGHPIKQSLPGIEASTGSLGHGLAMGAGMALAAKFDQRDYKTFILLSDGECQEGSTWETALFSSHHQLNNLIVIVDNNQFQNNGAVKDILSLEPLTKKWQSFGWNIKVINGHNFRQLLKAFEKAKKQKNKPTVIIANTIKGKGISFMENNNLWHTKSLSEIEYQQALKELS